MNQKSKKVIILPCIFCNKKLSKFYLGGNINLCNDIKCEKKYWTAYSKQNGFVQSYY